MEGAQSKSIANPLVHHENSIGSEGESLPVEIFGGASTAPAAEWLGEALLSLLQQTARRKGKGDADGRKGGGMCERCRTKG